MVIANPPYVRADSGKDYLLFRYDLEKSRMYKTLFEKWDLFVPFFERGLILLSKNGSLIFITSDAVCTSKYASKLREMILEEYGVISIDYFENIEIFEAGINPVILHIGLKGNVVETRKIIRENNFNSIKKRLRIPVKEFKQVGENAFRKQVFSLNLKVENLPLGNICYISYGLRPNSDERFWKGEFKTKDVVNDIKTEIHNKPFVEGKDLEAYRIKRIRYLEWGTERVPSKIARPTFPELYDPPKLIRGRMTPAVYDDEGIICSANAIVLKRYCDLIGINNRSIRNQLKKNNIRDRKELEVFSRNYDLKYLLAILNSKYAFFYLNNIRRHKMQNYFYPDDLKQLPIRAIPIEDQKPFIIKVNQILSLTQADDYLQNHEKQAKVKELEREIDRMVYELYELTPEEIEIVEGNYDG